VSREDIGANLRRFAEGVRWQDGVRWNVALGTVTAEPDRVTVDGRGRTVTFVPMTVEDYSRLLATGNISGPVVRTHAELLREFRKSKELYEKPRRKRK